MAKERQNELPLPKYDDLFTTKEQRDDEQLVKIREIPISEIDDFPDHPFKVLENEDMEQLVESIKERGVISPAAVRLKPDGRYELICGHRRKRACEIAGFETLRCEIVDVTREEAIILMVESNLSQRTVILPSEKAFAYKMRLEAMKRQVGRPTKNNNLVPVGQNYSREELSAKTGESQTQIQRYIRLTNLIPELLKLVDEDKMKMRPAVEISYLDEISQKDLFTEIELDEATPSHDQAKRMRKLFEEDKLSPTVIQVIMSEEKPNQKERFILHEDRIRSFIPKTVPIEKTEDYICRALEHYRIYLKKRAERDSR